MAKDDPVVSQDIRTMHAVYKDEPGTNSVCIAEAKGVLCSDTVLAVITNMRECELKTSIDSSANIFDRNLHELFSSDFREVEFDRKIAQLSVTMVSRWRLLRIGLQ